MELILSKKSRTLGPVNFTVKSAYGTSNHNTQHRDQQSESQWSSSLPRNKTTRQFGPLFNTEELLPTTGTESSQSKPSETDHYTDSTEHCGTPLALSEKLKAHRQDPVHKKKPRQATAYISVGTCQLSWAHHNHNSIYLQLSSSMKINVDEKIEINQDRNSQKV